ncbi:MAG: FHA domain-containing protein [Candidatus Cryptobacteroides sp.]|nr:FHA domain-containing protein [Candidatus Cryptobacteroides sp.]
MTDSGSTNGTQVNGVKLEPGKAAAIKTGDIIRIATLEFTVQ